MLLYLDQPVFSLLTLLSQINLITQDRRVFSKGET